MERGAAAETRSSLTLQCAHTCVRMHMMMIADVSVCRGQAFAGELLQARRARICACLVRVDAGATPLSLVPQCTSTHKYILTRVHAFRMMRECPLHHQ